MAGRGGFVLFSRRDGAVGFFFPGGTGRLLFFSEAGRGVCFFFRGETGWLFFFFSTGRDGAVFFFFRGPGRDGCFWRWQFFWRDGAKSLHRPAKGGLNRPASRPCKALQIINNHKDKKHFKNLLYKPIIQRRSFWSEHTRTGRQIQQQYPFNPVVKSNRSLHLGGEFEARSR